MKGQGADTVDMRPVMILWSIGVMFTCGAALFDLGTSTERRSRINSVSGIALILLLIGGIANIVVLAGR